MADLKISALNSLAGADLVAADVVAVVDDSASETKKLTVSDLIANGVTIISDATIPSAKILFSAGAIDTAELAASAVETAKINDSAVTAAKLADNSSVTLVSTLPASGAFTGQIALDTDDDKIYIWDGSAWDSVKGAGSINVVNGSTTGEINIVTSTSGDTVTVSATLDNTTAAAQFLGGPTGAAGAVGYRALVGTDLPTPTTSTKGGVIVNGEGLRMDSDTIEIDNDVTANSSTYQAVQFDSKGLITAGRDITAADLPEATAGAIGGVKPGSGLTMGSAGAINHSNAVTGATNTKITFDAQGHVTAGTSLSAADIPDLDTAKITTGTFPTERIADEAVTGDKLANYAVAQISETTPTAEFTSQFFFNPITRDLFLWDGNVFQPVGISAGEIVLAGTYDASTNLLDSVTAEGSAAGFTNGASLPAADTGNNRYYVVVTQTGTGTAPAPTVTLEPPDILLSNGTSYVLVETSETITAQIASNVGFTPTGNIAGTNVQAALSEVDSEKVAKAGDTMTGDLTLNNADVVFEGATENDFETTLTVTDPTADNSIVLPDVSGTVVTTGDTGSVTSTMITDGTIVNADINASAEIAVSKLANGTARQLLQTDAAGTGVEFTSNVDVPGTFDCTGAGTFDSTLTVTGVINADGKVKFPAGTAAAPSFYSGTDTNTGLYFSAADEVSVATGGTQRVVVDSSGDVGIGTSSPNAATGDKGLHIHSAASSGTRGACLHLTTNSSGTATSDGAEINLIDNDLKVFNKESGIIYFGTANSERMRIDSSGRLLANTTTSRIVEDSVGNGPQGKIQIEATNSDAIMSIISAGTSDANRCGTLSLGRHRNSSVGGTPTVVQDGDALGAICFAGGDGTDMRTRGATIIGQVDGTPGSNDMPGRLLFSTRADGGSMAERLRIDSSGNIGIGTASPSSILHLNAGTGDTRLNIEGGTNGDGILALAGTGSGTSKISFWDQLAIGKTSGGVGDISSEYLRIDSSGNLGIGTSSPASFLHIDSNNTYGSVVLSRDGGASGRRPFGIGISGSADDHLRISASSDTTGANAFANQIIEITSEGNVGIGTNAPSQILELKAAEPRLCINGTTANAARGIEFEIDGTRQASLLHNPQTGETCLSSGDNGSGYFINFKTDNSERMRIDRAGRLLVGTTSTIGEPRVDVVGNSATATDEGILQVRRGSSGTSVDTTLGVLNFGDTTSGGFRRAQIIAFADGAGGSGDLPTRLAFTTTADGASTPTERMRIGSTGTIQTYASSSTDSLFLSNSTSAGTSVILLGGRHSATSTTTGTLSFRVYTNGNVQNTNNSYGSLSDAKLKENIVDASSQWDDIKDLRVRNYNFIEGQTHTQIGVVAQEVETVSPGLVFESPDFDEDGNDLGTTTKSVNYSVLYMKAVKALQEAMTRIETLETKVAALEAE